MKIAETGLVTACHWCFHFHRLTFRIDSTETAPSRNVTVLAFLTHQCCSVTVNSREPVNKYKGKTVKLSRYAT